MIAMSSSCTLVVSLHFVHTVQADESLVDISDIVVWLT